MNKKLKFTIFFGLSILVTICVSFAIIHLIEKDSLKQNAKLTSEDQAYRRGFNLGAEFGYKQAKFEMQNEKH